MKVKEFNQLKKQVKGGNVKGLKKEVIQDLTLSQAQVLEDVLMDFELDEKMNKILDEIVTHIDNMVNAEKVANTKAPKVKTKEAPAKEAPEKAPAKPEKAPEEVKPFNKVNIGDTVRFRVEGEEIKHNIIIIYKGKNNLVGIMESDEQEVFLIRKTDFNKGIFSWTDRHGETYNIIVTL